MGEVLARFWENLGDRIGGPLSFRLILQPTMAAFLAVRAGMQDARSGRPAYFWSILTNATDRRERLREGWRAVTRVFVLAVVMDAAYQAVVLRWIYPGELLLVAFLLACVPYVVIRGPANRIAAAMRRHERL